MVADRSTNGTYVRMLAEQSCSNSKDIYLNKKEWISSGSGVISLGKPVSMDDANLVCFKCS